MASPGLKTQFAVMASVPHAVTLRWWHVQMLEQHWAKVVEPAVEIAPPEQASCSAGLRALVDAVEARVLADLHAGIRALFVQARPRRATPCGGCREALPSSLPLGRNVASLLLGISCLMRRLCFRHPG